MIGHFVRHDAHRRPDDRSRYLILADESAHPAVARWLEEVPAEAEVNVVIQSPDGTTAELPARSNGEVRCIVGADGAGLADQLRAWSPPAGDLIWAAGEAGAMLAVRQAARDLDLSPDDVEIDGYWKAGVAGRDHHEPFES